MSRILVVDDEAMLTELLANHLQDHGYITVTARTKLRRRATGWKLWRSCDGIRAIL